MSAAGGEDEAFKPHGISQRSPMAYGNAWDLLRLPAVELCQSISRDDVGCRHGTACDHDTPQ